LKILVLEYATALGMNDPSIYAEGNAMLNGLLDDLKDRNVDYLVSEDYENQNNEFNNSIVLKGDLMEWLNLNISNYDACLMIAPEQEFILYKITKLIEENGVKVIGSDSNAVMKCSDKYRMYESLKGKVSIIETEKVFFGNIEDYKYSGNKNKVVKPADGVSCSGVTTVNDLDSFKEAASNLQTELSYFIVQDFIEGISASVSLLSNGKVAIPLSLNYQDIELSEEGINYKGGYVPLSHEFEEEAKNIAKNAVESVNGIKGYVGVDMILGDKPYLVEINSRMTTPYVALKEILDLNLGEAILDSVYGKLPSEINLNGRISFYKGSNELKLRNE